MTKRYCFICDVKLVKNFFCHGPACSRAFLGNVSTLPYVHLLSDEMRELDNRYWSYFTFNRIDNEETI